MTQLLDEETEVQLQNPGTLQKVMDEFLSFTGQSEGLPMEVEEAEAQVAIARTRLDQSRETTGGNKGNYGTMAVDPVQAQAILLAIRTVGTQQDASNLQPDITRLKMVREGISGRGSEPSAKGAQGWEVQNQGVTRRRPGEGPGVNGGRAQAQQMDSYDQPQYAEAYDWKRTHDSFETQERVAEDKGAEKEFGEHGKTLERIGLSAGQARKASSGIAADHRKEDPNYYKNESRRIDEAMENLEEGPFTSWLKKGAAGMALAGSMMGAPNMARGDEQLPQNFQSQIQFDKGDSPQVKAQKKAQADKLQGMMQHDMDAQRDEFMGSAGSSIESMSLEDLGSELQQLIQKKKAGGLSQAEQQRGNEISQRIKALRSTGAR